MLDVRPDSLVARVAAGQYGVVHTVHLLGCGMSRDQVGRRVANGQFVRMYRSVFRLAGYPETWHARILAACWAGGFRSVASHRAAAHLWHLVPEPAFAEVTTPRWRRAQHPGLRVHESRLLAPRDCVITEGVPSTGPIRTLVDLAAVLPFDALESVWHAARRRKLCDERLLARRATELCHLGRPGRTKLERLIADLVAPVAESEPELELFRALRDAGVPGVERQYRVPGAGRGDIGVAAAKVIVEYDSDAHHLAPDELAADAARRNRFRRAGYTVVEARSADRRDGFREIVDTVLSLCVSSGALRARN